MPRSLGVQQAILYYVSLCKYTFAQRRNRLTTHFSERIPVVKRRIYVQLLGVFLQSRKASVIFVLSVCPHVLVRLLLDGFPWNLIFKDFMKVCRGTADLFKSRTKVSVTVREDLSTYLMLRATQIRTRKHCCTVFIVFILLTVACISIVHTELIVALLLGGKNGYTNAQQ